MEHGKIFWRLRCQIFTRRDFIFAAATYYGIVIRDTKDGTVVQKLESKAELANPVAFSADGLRLILRGKSLRIWDVTTVDCRCDQEAKRILANYWPCQTTVP